MEIISARLEVSHCGVCVCVHVHCVLNIASPCYRFFVLFSAENIGLYGIRIQLIFRSIRDRDIGTYHCAASNRAGSAGGTTTIQLIGELYNDR